MIIDTAQYLIHQWFVIILYFYTVYLSICLSFSLKTNILGYITLFLNLFWACYNIRSSIPTIEWSKTYIYSRTTQLLTSLMFYFWLYSEETVLSFLKSSIFLVLYKTQTSIHYVCHAFHEKKLNNSILRFHIVWRLLNE